MRAQNMLIGHGENVIFMVFGLNDGDVTDSVKDLCANFSGIARSVGLRFEADDMSAVMAFSANAWKRLFPDRAVPKELETFKEIKGAKHTAVSTPGDLFFHIRAKTQSTCYEMAQLIAAKIKDCTYHIDETHGFRYTDNRAIIGFVDGTENPESPEDYDFAVIGDNEPEFKGGSYVFAQKYIHDMDAWQRTPLEEQEKAIGRRKFDDIELSDEEKPSNAHNVLTNITDDDGNELKILRGNMPFANPSKGEFGTYFIGYANTFSTTRKMLENMFIGDPAGNHDRLLDFSTAVTGTLFFAPSVELLDELGE